MFNRMKLSLDDQSYSNNCTKNSRLGIEYLKNLQNHLFASYVESDLSFRIFIFCSNGHLTM